jgi:hypothetical protein
MMPPILLLYCDATYLYYTFYKANYFSSSSNIFHGAAWLRWCGVAQMVRRGSDGAAWLIMVRRGSVGSTSACCTAGPGSILGSAPQVGFSH